ncbi:MAG: SBBP repeat-containing protein [Nitrospirota bacterium]
MQVIHTKGFNQKGNSNVVSLIMLFSYVMAYLCSPLFINSLHAHTKTVTQVDSRSNINNEPENALIQFTSGNHVIGFKEDKVYVASMDHVLTVEFISANEIKPQAASGEAAGGKPPALGEVRYDNLWDGIMLTYDSVPKGIMASTYHLKAGADAGQIRLKYNVPLTIDDKGNLVLKFETGTMQESAPIAWQEIEGKKVPVEISFKVLGQREAGFKVAKHDAKYPLIIDPALSWSTFLGGAGGDVGQGIAVDTNGNVYVTGYSGATWGTPVSAYTGGTDAFAAKLDSAGALTWNTFLGGAGGSDIGYGIAVDTNGNVYVTGYSGATWGAPVSAYTADDAFAAKLTSAGALTWNTFLGGAGTDYGRSIAVDTNGNVYVGGDSDATWGAPVSAYTAGNDTFAAKLTSAGALTWNTFLGGAGGNDYGMGIAVDTSGNVYVGGYSDATWGTPVSAYTGGTDAFAAKLTSAGALTWNTFLGGAGTDVGYSIAVDTSGNVYVGGYSDATWGAPVSAYTAGNDTFAAKLDSAGALTWSTFLGGAGTDVGYGIAVDTSGNVYVGGYSDATWGTPVSAYTGGTDALAAKLDSAGALTWSTFLGGAGNDYGYGIAVDTSGNVYVGGYSDATWGAPVSAYSLGGDAFAAMIATDSSTVVGVPTLNQWGMIIFMSLVGIVSAYYLRKPYGDAI